MPDMKQWIPLGGLLVVLMFAAPASADNRRFEVMPFGGYRVGGDFDVEELCDTPHFAFGFHVDCNAGPNSRFQFKVLFARTSETDVS